MLKGGRKTVPKLIDCNQDWKTDLCCDKTVNSL